MLANQLELAVPSFERALKLSPRLGLSAWAAFTPARERTMFIEEIFESCELLSQDGERETVTKDYMQFGYDASILHHRNDIALAVTFQLTPGDEPAMQRILQENLSWRGGKHPWLQFHPSAGSIFKKIEGVAGEKQKIFQQGAAHFSGADQRSCRTSLTTPTTVT